MKVKADIMVSMSIEFDDEYIKNKDIEYTKEIIQMSEIRDLVDMETEDSVQIINVTSIEEI